MGPASPKPSAAGEKFPLAQRLAHMDKQRDHQEMEKRRLKAVPYFESGLGASEVARLLGVKR